MKFPAVHRRTVAAAVVVPGGPPRSLLVPGVPDEDPTGRALTVRGYAVKDLPHGGRLPHGARRPSGARARTHPATDSGCRAGTRPRIGPPL